MKAATLEIRIWMDKKSRKHLPDDLSEAFAPHAEHVASKLSEGYICGTIDDERFDGYWEIKSE